MLPSHPHSPVGPYGTASGEFTTFSVKRGAFELVVRFSSDQLADILNDELILKRFKARGIARVKFWSVVVIVYGNL